MKNLDLKKIILQVESVVNRFLNRKYNPNVKKAHFATYETITSEEDKIQDKFDGLTISFSHKDSEFTIEKFVYRIPQTRVYYYEYQNDYILLKVIKYFDIYIIIADDAIDSHTYSIGFEADKPIHSLFPKYAMMDDGVFELPGDTGFIGELGIRENIDLKDLDGFIKNLIEHEINNHPLASIESLEFDYLSTIDHEWSRLRYIDSNNRIDVNNLCDDDIYNFIWLLEIYIWLGWFDKINLFYEEINKNNINKDNLFILQKTYHRYYNICKLIGKEIPETDAIIQESSTDNSDNCLNIYFNSIKQKSNDIVNKLQKDWDIYHRPALQLKLNKMTARYPDDYLAFAYLILIYRFWWFPEFEKILIQYLPESKKNLWQLLSLIYKSGTMRFREDSIFISNFPSISDRQVNEYMLGMFSFRSIRRQRDRYTYLNIHNSVLIKINKDAEFLFMPGVFTIEIIPQLLYPLPEFKSKIKIELTQYSIIVPLVWDQFTIEVNNCRFKFIRKKNRFQITIRFDRKTPHLKINSDKIINENRQIVKYYIPLIKKENVLNIAVFNEYGAKIKRINPKYQNFVFTGYGLNRFGILNTDFNLAINNLKKSFQIDLNEIKKVKIQNYIDDQNLVFRSSQFDPYELRSASLNSLLYFINYSRPMELLKQMILYIDDYQNNYRKVRKLVYTNLGFIPKCDAVENIRPDRDKIVIMLSNEFNGQKLAEKELFKVIKFDKKAHQNALWWNLKYLHMLFSETFFEAVMQ